ncbi:putative conserved membrane protein [Synechococcus sp. A18-25c]|uniref:cytochrome B6 n=1 Tax=unclassified Synechococcus TaxID=2626047 RepID=UPI00164916C4|nr:MULTISPECIES: cytochrome B6 [unclassified Synechococcus]QNI49724.1 putative conserved membrane protein [Synechococcus sp. A15-60]QNJ21331.1 putative conserved membrane protein [Synechococcus sp. A18-25c]
MAALQSLITFAFTTAGDAADGLLFGWEIATIQKWVLIYLGVSSLAFVLVWLVGALRTKG